MFGYVTRNKAGKADERHSPATLRKIVDGMESLNSIQHRLMLIYVDGFSMQERAVE
jgi:hypothetical protein